MSQYTRLSPTVSKQYKTFHNVQNSFEINFKENEDKSLGYWVGIFQWRNSLFFQKIYFVLGYCFKFIFFMIYSTQKITKSILLWWRKIFYHIFSCKTVEVNHEKFSYEIGFFIYRQYRLYTVSKQYYRAVHNIQNYFAIDFIENKKNY